jgi:hypothetical protein
VAVEVAGNRQILDRRVGNPQGAENDQRNRYVKPMGVSAAPIR